MAKPPSSAIGIDLGRHSFKAVLLQRRGADRFQLTHYAIREVEGEPGNADEMAAHLKALLHDLGAKAKACALTLSGADSFVRIVEQPAMAPQHLRDALRLNGSGLLNQDCREMVLDCDVIPSSEPVAAGQGQEPGVRSYVVGGLPRRYVALLEESSQKIKMTTSQLELGPVALFNAFEYAHGETFANQAFVLVDIGHRSTSLIVGVKGELILVRTLEYGGAQFTEELICHGAASPEEIFQYLAEEEVLTVENARLSLTELVRSISSSIGFVEARRDTSIPRVFVSGGLACSASILKLLTEELQLPCDAWNPFERCEVALSGARQAAFPQVFPLLGAACGAASELLHGR